MSQNDFFAEFKTKHHLCAKQCCICHKTLTDPSSIEYGIGPVCRKNGNYDDAPVLSESQIKPLIAAIDAAFPSDASSELKSKIRVDSSTITRQMAKCTIYYASSLIGSKEAGRMIHCIRVLICLGYDKLACRLLAKSYGHTVWPRETEDKSPLAEGLPYLYYRGPFNKLVNSYLKTQFKGQWDNTQRHWVIRGQLLDCMAMLVAAEVGDLPLLPPSPPLKIKPHIPQLQLPPQSPPQTLKFPILIKGLLHETSNKKIPIAFKAKVTETLVEEKTTDTAFPSIKLKVDSKTVSVSSPFNWKFKTDVKNLMGAHWDHTGKQWVVDLAKMAELKGLLTQYYPNLPIQII